MKADFFLLVWAIATFIVYLLAAVVIQDKIAEINGIKPISSAILNQVADDWTTQPFVDVKIVDADNYECPRGYPEIVMERIFYGTQSACDCTGVFGFGI